MQQSLNLTVAIHHCKVASSKTAVNKDERKYSKVRTKSLYSWQAVNGHSAMLYPSLLETRHHFIASLLDALKSLLSSSLADKIDVLHLAHFMLAWIIHSDCASVIYVESLET